MLFASGQLGIDPVTGNFVEGAVKEQTAQAFRNVKAILSEAGYGIGDVVKTTVYLADMGDFALCTRYVCNCCERVTFSSP